MTRLQIIDLPAHQHDGIVYVNRSDVLELHREICNQVEAVLEAFDQGVFIRDTSHDNEPGAMMRLLKPIAALAALQRMAQES